MIWVTRLNGQQYVLNADLIEQVEAFPDTVITLVDGRKHLVAEGAQEIVDRVVAYRASVLDAPRLAVVPANAGTNGAGRREAPREASVHLFEPRRTDDAPADTNTHTKDGQ